MRPPLRPLHAAAPSRHVLVTPEIDALLDGHVALGEFPDWEAERLIGKFSAGWLVTVSRQRTQKRPDLERLEGFHEIWALCPRRPRPGWRILGRFYERGVFVGLRAWPKDRLAGRYGEATAEVVDDWEEIFGSQPAHTGKNLIDYVGPGLFQDVDQQD